MPIPIGLIAAGISALGSLAANKANADYNASEAVKNRDFQLDMYNRQFNDAVNFWNQQQKFNSPANQLHRLTEAGLNPLLMYGEGGVQNVATQQPNLPSQPSGSQAHASFVNPFETAQYLLLDAQRDKLEAEAEKTRSEIDWQEIENRFSRDAYNVRLAIQHGNLELLNVEMEKMRVDMLNSSRITNEQVQTMVQGRLYEIKRFDLDSEYLGKNFNLSLQNLDIQREQMRQNWFGLKLQWQALQNEIRWTDNQIGQLQWNVLKDKAMFGEQFKQLRMDTQLKRWDWHLKKADFTLKQRQIFNQTIRNQYLWKYGSETIENKVSKYAGMLDNAFLKARYDALSPVIFLMNKLPKRSDIKK